MAVSSLVNHFWIHFFILFVSISISSISGSEPNCVYTVYIRTGSIIKGGTDSNITLTLFDANGYGIRINNLELWGGLMGPGYDYFERGNLDIFSGPAPCLTSPVCLMNLTSDGTGSGHGWYVNYVEVTTTGIHKACTQQLFTVEQWLATDASPYELTAIRDQCKRRTKSGVNHQPMSVENNKPMIGENKPIYDSGSFPRVAVV